MNVAPSSYIPGFRNKDDKPRTINNPKNTLRWFPIDARSYPDDFLYRQLTYCKMKKFTKANGNNGTLLANMAQASIINRRNMPAPIKIEIVRTIYSFPN